MRIITVTRVGRYQERSRMENILECMRPWVSASTAAAIEWVQCKNRVYRRGQGISEVKKTGYFPHCVNIRFDLCIAYPGLSLSSRNVHVKLFASGKIHVTGLKIGSDEQRWFCEFLYSAFCITVLDLEPVMYKVGFRHGDMIDQALLCRHIVSQEFIFLAEIFTSEPSIPKIEATFGLTDYNGTKIVVKLPDGVTKINAFSTGSVMMSGPSLPLIYSCWEILRFALQTYEASVGAEVDADARDQDGDKEGAPFVDVVAPADASAAASSPPAPSGQH